MAAAAALAKEVRPALFRTAIKSADCPNTENGRARKIKGRIMVELRHDNNY